MTKPPFNPKWTEEAELHRIYEIIEERARDDQHEIWLGPIREGNIEKLRADGFKVTPTWNAPFDCDTVVGYWIRW